MNPVEASVAADEARRLLEIVQTLARDLLPYLRSGAMAELEDQQLPELIPSQTGHPRGNVAFPRISCITFLKRRQNYRDH